MRAHIFNCAIKLGVKAIQTDTLSSFRYTLLKDIFELRRGGAGFRTKRWGNKASRGASKQNQSSLQSLEIRAFTVQWRLHSCWANQTLALRASHARKAERAKSRDAKGTRNWCVRRVASASLKVFVEDSFEMNVGFLEFLSERNDRFLLSKPTQKFLLLAGKRLFYSQKFFFF